MTTGRVASRHEILKPRHPWVPEATEQFTCHGKEHSLRPDEYAEVELNGAIRRIFLEWDRGTTRHTKHLREKFENYAHYFATHTEPPVLLIVTVSPHRESVIRGLLRDALDGRHPASVLTSIDSLVERLGPLGNVWRPLGGSSRMSWPGHATLV
jgi:hypothetical protein